MLNRRHTGLICAAITIAYLIVGLWPFNFLPRNDVEWLSNHRGIHFKEQSVVYSEGMLEHTAPAAVPEMTIELLLAPESEPTEDIFPMLSI